MRRILNIVIAFLLVLPLASCRKELPYFELEGESEYLLSDSPVMLSLHIRTNCSEWTYDKGDASWITEKGRSGASLMLSVSANTAVEPRSAELWFYSPAKGEGALSFSLKVTQQGRGEDPEIVAEPLVQLPWEASSSEVAVSTNLASWICEKIEGGGWLSFTVSGSAVLLTAEENPDEAERAVRLRIYAPDKENALAFKDIRVVQAAREVHYDTECLSTEGSSNCYLISHRGVYTFDATVKGNGKASSGLSAPGTLAPAGAKLVWQTRRGMISELSLSDGFISFTAARIPGSAVIAATDASGAIIWSWHIWYPEVQPEALSCAGGGTMMNMNLGARSTAPSSPDSHGMLYQWGRKDPFPHTPVAAGADIYTTNIPVYDISGNTVKIQSSSRYDLANNTLAYSIAHPETCLSNNAQFSTCRDWLKPAESNVALWGNPDGLSKSDGKYVNRGTKSFYDPCPQGWMLPCVADFIGFTESGGYTWAQGDTENGLEFMDLGGVAEVAVVDFNGDGVYTLADYNCGWWFWLDKAAGVMSYFPAAARYDGQYAMLMGSVVGIWGNYWTNCASLAPDDNATATALSFSIQDYNKNWSFTLSPVSNGSRADAYSVRCVKE